MLHPIKPVTCLAEMNRLLGFQRGVLELGIALATGSALDDATFKRVLNDDAGRWFWDVHKRNNEWRDSLTSLVTAFTSEYSSQAQVLMAFDNDVKFQDHLDDPTYSFQYPALPSSLRVGIKKLFELFYEYAGGTGYPEEIHGKSGFKITRDFFIREHENVAANGILHVCPVCDQEISDRHPSLKIAICQLDHFFPKSKYPFLSMHPFNLIPTCSNCNSVFKTSADPLADGINFPPASQGTFLNTYHPHKGRSIRELGKISINRNPQLEYQAQIQDSHGVSSYRIDSAQRVCKLPSRWKSRLNKERGIIPKVVEWMLQESKRRYLKGPLSINAMVEDLESICDRFAVTQDSHHVLRDAYIQFALNDVEEKKYLFQEYSNSA
jgi:hypothetical protein